MKPRYISFAIFLLNTLLSAQNFTPVNTTHYNFDAIAENTTALANTSGAIDGSDFVMHSQAYAALYSMTVGLPNSGIISSANRTFQLQPYNQNNCLYLTAGQSDSILLVTPAAFNAVNVLGFATEGNATMNITLRFTDNSTQTYNGLSVLDWFSGAGSIYSNFGRVGRTTGIIANPPNAPHLYPHVLVLNCPNRIKLIKSIRILNTSANPRICMLAVSGNSGPLTYSVQGDPVTCPGGTNGTATVTAIGGIGPYTYNWSTQPVQSGSTAVNLSAGPYSFTIADAGGCTSSGSVVISQTNGIVPPLFVSSNGTAVCAGNTIALAVSGASTYTWSTGSNAQLIILTPTASGVYTVCGPNPNNCIASGSIFIQVNSLPQPSISNLLNGHCINAPGYSLTMLPGSGVLSGPGIQNSAVFQPSLLSVGITTLSFSYTNTNGCAATVIYSTQIFALPQVSVAINPSMLCNTSVPFTLTPFGIPSGGLFTGTGISGIVFNPQVTGVGTHSINYTYSDANGCSNSATTAVQVHSLAAPSVSISKTFYCINAANVNLGGIPTGGQFSGPGTTTAGVFNPALAAAGQHTLVYTITSGPCQASAFKTVTVSTCSGIEATSTIHLKWQYLQSRNCLEYYSTSPCYYEIYSITGNCVAKNQTTQTHGYIELNDFVSGCYLLKFESSSKQGTYRWCKEN
ncbi:MAG: hypothetical protein RIR05_402 [Bacteroidota bacterium]